MEMVLMAVSLLRYHHILTIFGTEIAVILLHPLQRMTLEEAVGGSAQYLLGQDAPHAVVIVGH